MPKFYQYLIYKIYTWRQEKNDDTPITTVILLLSIVHIFYLLIIYYIAIDLLGFSMDLVRPKSFLMAAILLSVMCLNFLVFYNKKASVRYIERFKDESEKERARGNFAVIAFFIGSTLFTFIVMITYFGNYIPLGTRGQGLTLLTTQFIKFNIPKANRYKIAI
jgi:hypothetical protein